MSLSRMKSRLRQERAKATPDGLSPTQMVEAKQTRITKPIEDPAQPAEAHPRKAPCPIGGAKTNVMDQKIRIEDINYDTTAPASETSFEHAAEG